MAFKTSLLLLSIALHLFPATCQQTLPPLLTAISTDPDLSTFYSLFNSTGGGSGRPAPDLDERFNNGQDGLYRIAFAPTNHAFEHFSASSLPYLTDPFSYQLLVALLRTHLTDPVARGSVNTSTLSGQTFRAAEGWSIAVSQNGSLTTNVERLGDSEVPLTQPQANLVRNSQGQIDEGVPASNGHVYKIDAFIDPFITFFGEDASRSDALPPVEATYASDTMADILATEPDLSSLNNLLGIIAPDFQERLSLSDSGSNKTTTTVFIAPDNSALQGSTDAAAWPYNVDFSRTLLTRGFGEFDRQASRIKPIGRNAQEIEVIRDRADNVRVTRRLQAENGEVWIAGRWLDPIYNLRD